MATVLLVDDQRLEREIWRRAIERLRHEVIEATDGDQVIGILEKHPEIKIVITDTRMNRMGGIMLLQAMWRYFDNEDMPKVLIHSREKRMNFGGDIIPDLEVFVRQYFGEFAEFALKSEQNIAEFLHKVAPPT